jgi:glutaredoxin
MNKLHLKYDEKVLEIDYTRDDLKELIYGDTYVGMAQPLTVPQIFVYNKRIGGYEDFVEYCDNHGLNER